MADQSLGALDIRFIELMPFDGNEWSPNKMMSYVEAIDYLKDHEVKYRVYAIKYTYRCIVVYLSLDYIHLCICIYVYLYV
jgi:molybdenum cofactor biosynthesis enzyme MoaA